MGQVKYDTRDGFPLSFYDVRAARGDESSAQDGTATAEAQRHPQRDPQEATRTKCAYRTHSDELILQGNMHTQMMKRNIAFWNLAIFLF